VLRGVLFWFTLFVAVRGGRWIGWCGCAALTVGCEVAPQG